MTCHISLSFHVKMLRMEYFNQESVPEVEVLTRTFFHQEKKSKINNSVENETFLSRNGVYHLVTVLRMKFPHKKTTCMSR